MPTQKSRPPRVRPDAPTEVSAGVMPTVSVVVALAIPLIIVSVVVAAVLPAVSWWFGVVVGLAVAAALVWRRMQSAHDSVLQALGLDRGTVESVRLTNMVQSLSLAAGIEEPEAVVLSDDAANALAVARNGDTTLVVTSGLLARLEPVELEGVVAELLVRLGTGDAEAATIVTALYHLPLVGPISSVLTAPVTDIGRNRLLGEERDLEADRLAVGLTRYPPGLLGALSKIAECSRRPAGVSDDLDELWMVPPGGASSSRSASRSPLTVRIDVLAEL